MDGGSPLMVYNYEERQQALARGCKHARRAGDEPRLAHSLESAVDELLAKATSTISSMLPLAPHRTLAQRWAQSGTNWGGYWRKRRIPGISFIRDYADGSAYMDAGESARESFFELAAGCASCSYHGIPRVMRMKAMTTRSAVAIPRANWFPHWGCRRKR